MSTAIERFDDAARRRVGALGRTRVHDGELLRHPVYTRLLHWSAAIFFILALLSGFALYTPWLFHAVTPLFGSGAMTRELHPWFSLGFVLVFLLQILNWLTPMRWTPADRRWMRHFRAYISNTEKLEPEDVGFFNAGQKLYFWAIVGSTIVFLISGIPMWMPEIFGRHSVMVGYVLHDVAALVMLGGFIVHLYESTAQQPGTFQAMTRGTVSRPWAWTHHPNWYREVTQRDPRADYEQARERQKEHDRNDAA
jgi:formate dehydrogenase subunit gamma